MVEDSEDHVIAELEAGRAQLWPGEVAAIVTQCVQRSDGRFLHVWLAGGLLGGLMALRPGVEAWGRAQGCDFVTINGRLGWARVLKPHGFATVNGELRKRL